MFWTAIGLAFRMIDLTALPPWTDECATIAFSAGHGFRAVPTDQLITTAELTAPLWFDPSSSARDVWHFLRTESTHPPLYFFLAHYWMRLWSPVAGFSWESREALLWLARSLPALLGVASIPAMFGLARLAWGRSVGAIAIAQLAAALMAISPFAISLAREARHYTLVLLFVIGSIACTIAIVRHLATQTLPTLASNRRHPSSPYTIAFIWGLINACGMATHYFFGLTLAIEAATVFSAIGWWGVIERRWLGRSGWSVLITAAIPTIIGVIVWIPAWQSLGDNTLTDWVYDGTPGWDAIFRLLSWLTAMFFALPTDDLSLSLGWVIANGLVLLALFLALVRWVSISVSAMVASRSWRSRSAIAPIAPIAPITRIALGTILGLVGFGLAAILTLTFGFQSDLTLAIRFSYPYFPALVLLVSIGLGQFWQRGIWQPIAIVLIAGVVGATTTMFDLTYLQHHRPDHMADVIADRAELPVVLATRHKHHGQTGRLIGVAWELGRLADQGQTSLNFDDPKTANVRYILARYVDHNEIDPSPPPTSPTQTSGETLRQVVLARSTAIEVWPLNFRATIDWDGTGCEVDPRDRPDVREYDYRRFICPSGRR
ncbi:MAG: hypothetical protein HC795_06795 [Coleofasciculaceae cyanobacterium RL_1_1]|nr:hypothetical protein [Coleofasciculaceae cyanobacterium RL_1_1]